MWKRYLRGVSGEGVSDEVPQRREGALEEVPRRRCLGGMPQRRCLGGLWKRCLRGGASEECLRGTSVPQRSVSEVPQCLRGGASEECLRRGASEECPGGASGEVLGRRDILDTHNKLVSYLLPIQCTEERYQYNCIKLIFLQYKVSYDSTIHMIK